MGVKVVVAPTEEPISALDCARQLQRDGAWSSPPEDQVDADRILDCLRDARAVAESFTGWSIAQKTLELALDAFPAHEIELPRGPVQTILSVVYVDADGVAQTISEANYVLDEHTHTTWLMPAEGYAWPATKALVNAVKVRYQAGFSLPGDSPQTHPLPEKTRRAILLIMAHFDSNRENSTAGITVENIPLGAFDLLRLEENLLRMGMA